MVAYCSYTVCRAGSGVCRRGERGCRGQGRAVVWEERGRARACSIRPGGEQQAWKGQTAHPPSHPSSGTAARGGRLSGRRAGRGQRRQLHQHSCHKRAAQDHKRSCSTGGRTCPAPSATQTTQCPARWYRSCGSLLQCSSSQEITHTLYAAWKPTLGCKEAMSWAQGRIATSFLCTSTHIHLHTTVTALCAPTLLLHDALQVGQQAVLALQHKGHLRDQHRVHDARRQGRLRLWAGLCAARLFSCANADVLRVWVCQTVFSSCRRCTRWDQAPLHHLALHTPPQPLPLPPLTAPAR